MKRTYAAIMLIAVLCVFPQSCGRKPPALEEIYDRVVYLIEGSYEINEIFFGKGLPTYPRVEQLEDKELTYSEKYGIYYLLFKDEEAGDLCMYYDNDAKEYRYAKVVPESKLTGNEKEALFYFEDLKIYLFPTDYTLPEIEYEYDDNDNKTYNVVRFDAPYLSIAEIKEAAEKIYSAEYLEGVYQAAFDGVSSTIGDTFVVAPARYMEQDRLLRQHKDAKNLIRGKRIYDYSTMKITKPYNSERIYITIDSHLEGSDEILNVRLSLVLQDGQWYLNSPTY